jgi:hypothetical protein
MSSILFRVKVFFKDCLSVTKAHWNLATSLFFEYYFLFMTFVFLNNREGQSYDIQTNLSLHRIQLLSSFFWSSNYIFRFFIQLYIKVVQVIIFDKTLFLSSFCVPKLNKNNKYYDLFNYRLFKIKTIEVDSQTSFFLDYYCESFRKTAKCFSILSDYQWFSERFF